MVTIGEGKLYSWGRGYIGHNRLTEDDKPRRIESKTQNRKFTAVVCNNQALVLFAPMQVYSLSPRCGPACGGTVLSIIGTALKNTPDIKVRFKYADEVKEVSGSYIEQRYVDQRLKEDQPALQAIFCTTPTFESEVKADTKPEAKDETEAKQEVKIKFPQKATISVALDGIHYIECEQDFLIYPSDIRINNGHPRCGPVIGGTELTMMIDIDPMITGYLFNMCFGFQSRPVAAQPAQTKDDKNEPGAGDTTQKSNKHVSKVGTLTSRATMRMLGGQGQVGGAGMNMTVNPLDPNEQQLEAGNWLCALTNYQSGKITCKAPKLTKYDHEALQYNVDIALNGQQFSGYPILFRYYGKNKYNA